jgi:hypothetical protein
VLKLKRNISKVIDTYSVSVNLYEMGKSYSKQFSELKDFSGEDFICIPEIVEKQLKAKKMRTLMPCDIVWLCLKEDERCPHARISKYNYEMRIKEKNMLKNTKKKQMKE